MVVVVEGQPVVVVDQPAGFVVVDHPGVVVVQPEVVLDQPGFGVVVDQPGVVDQPLPC